MCNCQYQQCSSNRNGYCRENCSQRRYAEIICLSRVLFSFVVRDYKVFEYLADKNPSTCVLKRKGKWRLSFLAPPDRSFCCLRNSVRVGSFCFEVLPTLAAAGLMGSTCTSYEAEGLPFLLLPCRAAFSVEGHAFRYRFTHFSGLLVLLPSSRASL